eukprot:1252679-Prymnesium_polylepis.2
MLGSMEFHAAASSAVALRGAFFAELNASLAAEGKSSACRCCCTAATSRRAATRAAASRTAARQPRPRLREQLEFVDTSSRQTRACTPATGAR